MLRLGVWSTLRVHRHSLSCIKTSAHFVVLPTRRPQQYLRSHSTAPQGTGTPVASDPITHLKSTFQAYAASITIPHVSSDTTITSIMRSKVVPDLLAHIYDLAPRTRRASHAMYAWRLHPETRSNERATTVYGSSNGGEAGAGERLERLLELGRCDNVVVIVFRWYGGVKLGSDRWRCISSVAKSALERGGFLVPSGSDSRDRSGSSRGSKRR
ncbi:ribosomal protein S5 domain 2-like protein [Cubamyces sp. BRFM 1775]|nr:ribosomal protein S5 domain 2-like protein [Cubamyces sp. BRFM 1775]